MAGPSPTTRSCLVRIDADGGVGGLFAGFDPAREMWLSHHPPPSVAVDDGEAGSATHSPTPDGAGHAPMAPPNAFGLGRQAEADPIRAPVDPVTGVEHGRLIGTPWATGEAVPVCVCVLCGIH